MNQGYIRIPRSLLRDPLWLGLPSTYQRVYLTILENVVYKDTTQNAFGKLIHLKPGQMLTTIRRLVILCECREIDRNIVDRSLKRFFELGFSRQDSRHGKTVITITRDDICELCETRFETRSRQDRDIKEEREERKEENAHARDPLSGEEEVDPTLAQHIKQRKYDQ